MFDLSQIVWAQSVSQSINQSMDMYLKLQHYLQGLMQGSGNAAFYIFQPASADKVSLATLLFVLAFTSLPWLPYTLLLLLTGHVAMTFFYHTINLAKLHAQEDLLTPAQSQLQLLLVGYFFARGGWIRSELSIYSKYSYILPASRGTLILRF